MANRMKSSSLEACLPGRVVLDECELRITMRHLRSPWTRYTGSRRAIEETGLVPSSIEWADGFAKAEWVGPNGLRYRLGRIRPYGTKGPRRAFMFADSWELFVQSPVEQYDADEIRAKERELIDLKRRRSPEGRAEWCEQYSRLNSAKKDSAFQALLASIVPSTMNGGLDE